MKFKLRFPLTEVDYWAARYDYPGDDVVIAIGEKAAARGYYMRREFLAVTHWKTRGRTDHWCAENTEAAIRSTTRLALAAADERDRIEALLRLRGVQLPTASALLHLVPRLRLPIIDFRALWSLGIDEPPVPYRFDFWWAYVEVCRGLAMKADVPMRRLDRALWQHSYENQPRGGSAGPRVSGTPPEVGNASTFPVETYTRVVAAAIEQRTLYYSDLPGGRGNWARDLYRIAAYEQSHKRPPLTVIVVHKQDGWPGEGAGIVLRQAGYRAGPGESSRQLWERGVADVFAYWKP